MNKNIFFRIIGNISMLWWSIWSNIRFRRSIRNNIGVNNEDSTIKTLDDIYDLVKRLYKKFKWTKDGISQLGDAITPPPQNYQHYLDGLLKDDCDGFHSLVYHVLYNNGIKCYLLTVNTIKGGHCVLLFNHKNRWYINDYVRIYGGKESIEDVILEYNKEYSQRYNRKKVVFNGFIKYDYTSKKFSMTKIKKI